MSRSPLVPEKLKRYFYQGLWRFLPGKNHSSISGSAAILSLPLSPAIS
jgi:hypothetical protein